jgi:hypothetical protein
MKIDALLQCSETCIRIVYVCVMYENCLFPLFPADQPTPIKRKIEFRGVKSLGPVTQEYCYVCLAVCMSHQRFAAAK